MFMQNRFFGEKKKGTVTSEEINKDLISTPIHLIPKSVLCLQPYHDMLNDTKLYHALEIIMGINHNSLQYK